MPKLHYHALHSRLLQILAQRPHIMQSVTVVLVHCKYWDGALHQVTTTSCYGTSLEYGFQLFPLFHRNGQQRMDNITIRAPISFPIHHLLIILTLYATPSELLTASLNK